MGTLDPDMGALVSRAMRDMGITVRTGEAVTAVSERAVHTAAGEIPADLVVLGLGVAPNSGLAAAAGLQTGVRSAIVVDRQQRTSAAGVWAAGDCCQSIHVVSGRPVSPGPRHGRQQAGSGGRDQHRRRLRHLPGRGGHGRDPHLRSRDRPHRLVGTRGDRGRIRLRGGRRSPTTTSAGYMPDAAGR